MAKWEERDPRWIVEQRPDAKNVNGWHWEEKNCTDWATKRLNQLFVQIKGEKEHISYLVDKAEKCSGELNWYNRKGKRFILFELDISVSWQAEISGSKLKGILAANEVNQDEEEKADWKMTIKEGKAENKDTQELKKLLVKEMASCFKQMMVELFQIQEEKLPQTPNSKKKNNEEDEKNEQKFQEYQQKEKEIQRQKEEEGAKTELTLQYNFQANPSDLYDCLLNPQRICIYTRGPAQMEPRVGGVFNLYNGAITGEILELEKDQKIVMKWKIKDWPSHSIVTVSLQKQNGTLLKLHQKEIPAHEFERTKNGWKNYYWEPVRVVFGYSYNEK